MEFMENNSAKNKLCDIKSMLEQIIYYINKYNVEKIMWQMTVAIW